MIPKSVTREHVLAALRVIDRDGVPAGRDSRGYDLVHDGKRHPPKYAVALAIAAATGAPPHPDAFGVRGGACGGERHRGPGAHPPRRHGVHRGGTET